MNLRSMVLVAILWMAPFTLLDFSTKYLAHAELTLEDQMVGINRYFTAVKPIRNYGTIWVSTTNEDERAYLFHSVYLFVILPLSFFWLVHLHEETLRLRLGSAMAIGGSAGNTLEFAVFGGATDFLSIENTGTFLDNYICNLADVFIYLGLLIWFGPEVIAGLLTYVWAFVEDGFWSLWKRLTFTERRLNYTPEMANEIIEKYKKGDPLEDIASSFGKSVASIRGKLVSEGVYRKFEHLRMHALLREPQLVTEPIELQKGAHLPMDELLTLLNDAGYLRTTTLREPGQYTVMGGIVDIYGFGTKHPVRVDYFGDTIESLWTTDRRSNLKVINLMPFDLQGA